MPTTMQRKLRKWLRALPSWKERRLYFIVRKAAQATDTTTGGDHAKR